MNGFCLPVGLILAASLDFPYSPVIRDSPTLLSSLTSAPAFDCQGAKTDGSDDSVRFTYYQRCIYVQASVNEEASLWFLLDTGANVSAIDLKAAERLKLSLSGNSSVEGSAGVIPASETMLQSVSIGKAQRKPLRVIARDLSSWLAPPNTTLDGILGYDFLRHFALRIDFVKQRIEFLPGPVKRTALANVKGTRISFKIDNGIPRLTGTLDDRVQEDFRLDTGASLFDTPDIYINITEDTWKQLTVLEPRLAPDRYFTGTGVGGVVKLPVSRIRTLSLGSVSITAPFVIVQPKTGYFARKDAAGFLSNNFLEKYSPVIIDYMDHSLTFPRRDCKWQHVQKSA